ncbi:MAG: 30S ribosomal protein S5 [Candidatus Dojkabacteria bacterium]|nr:30S ribosomal protein S5 [Candidatus Dojkabacteria bacterium]
METNNKQQNNTEFESYVLYTSRVTKVVKGGKRLKFQALVVVGNRKNKVGLGFAKGVDPKSAIEKATRKAKKNLKHVVVRGTTVPYDVMSKFKSARIFVKPAKPGTGLIASKSIRPVLELGGIQDVYSKVYGTKNKIANAYCIFNIITNFKSK